MELLAPSVKLYSLCVVVCMCVCVLVAAFPQNMQNSLMTHPQIVQMPRLCHNVRFPHGEVQPKSLIGRSPLAGDLHRAFGEKQFVVLRKLAADR